MALFKSKLMIPAFGLLLSLSFMMGTYLCPANAPPQTEVSLQSECLTYCTSRCTYCPYCSDCLKQVCVQECNCNNQCKGYGFFDHVNNCRCANLNFDSMQPQLVLHQLLIEAPPVQFSDPAHRVPLMMYPNDPFSSYV
jgi:hypothetical protein